MKKVFLPARSLAVIAIFAALTAVLAQISFPLPFTPVPISFGLVAVYMTGIILEPRQAIYAQICYLTLGAVGLPVFSNFNGGIAALLGPTGGFLMMYPLMAWMVSFALNSRISRQNEASQPKFFILLKAVLSLCAAQFILYAGGVAWLGMTTSSTFSAALSLAVLPFIPLDLVKLLFCVCSVLPLRHQLKWMNQTAVSI